MSAARKKGTAWESQIVAYLREHGCPHAERHPPHGAHDVGDIAGLPGIVIEAKNCRQADWASWVNEAEREAKNAGPGTHGVLWTKRRGKSSPADGYVVMTGRQWLDLLRAAGHIDPIEASQKPITTVDAGP